MSCIFCSDSVALDSVGDQNDEANEGEEVDDGEEGGEAEEKGSIEGTDRG